MSIRTAVKRLLKIFYQNEKQIHNWKILTHFLINYVKQKSWTCFSASPLKQWESKRSRRQALPVFDVNKSKVSSSTWTFIWVSICSRRRHLTSINKRTLTIAWQYKRYLLKAPMVMVARGERWVCVWVGGWWVRRYFKHNRGGLELFFCFGGGYCLSFC